MIRLETVRQEDKALLWNLHQKYLYEMTNYYGNEMDAQGNYQYGYFDAYFTEPERTALLIYEDTTLIGFAMLNPYSYFGAHFCPFRSPRPRRRSTAHCTGGVIWVGPRRNAFSAHIPEAGKSNTTKKTQRQRHCGPA